MTPISDRRRWAAGLLLALTACGGAEPGRRAVVPAAGSLSVNGTPAAHAELILVPVEAGGPGAQAVVGADGQYRLTTYVTGDGAVAGDYLVGVIWPSRPAEDREPDEGENRAPRRDRLGGRFADPKRSGLRLQVPPGGGTLAPLDVRAADVAPR